MIIKGFLLTLNFIIITEPTVIIKVIKVIIITTIIFAVRIIMIIIVIVVVVNATKTFAEIIKLSAIAVIEIINKCRVVYLVMRNFGEGYLLCNISLERL